MWQNLCPDCAPSHFNFTSDSLSAFTRIRRWRPQLRNSGIVIARGRCGSRFCSGHRKLKANPTFAKRREKISCVNRKVWRRGRDSNPRYPFGYAGFQDRCHQPLGHLSGVIESYNRSSFFGGLLWERSDRMFLTLQLQNCRCALSLVNFPLALQFTSHH
jgi:hypothetical protein